MTRNSFLKTCLSVVGLAATPKLLNAEVIEAKIKDDEYAPHFIVYATKNITLPVDGGKYETNVYGEYCRLITQVMFPEKFYEQSKALRFESPLILASTLNESDWAQFKNAVIAAIKIHRDKARPIMQFAPVIKLTKLS